MGDDDTPPPPSLSDARRARELARRADAALAASQRRRAVKLYLKGSTVRAIAAELGRSYGWVHRALVESEEVELRPRGGYNARHRKSK